MKIKFDLRECKWIADTEGQAINVHLRECYSVSDVLEAMNHEIKHAMINMFKRNTTADEDHWIIKRWDIDQF